MPDPITYVYREDTLQYREPVFTHDRAENAWGKSFWHLSGRELLSWIRTAHKGAIGLDLHAMYDHRMFFSENSKRLVVWAIKPKLNEIPEDILSSYVIEVDIFPSNLLSAEARQEYLIQKAWSHLYFKWDSLSMKPHEFNLLLAKIIATAERERLGLVILDTKDLYVNYNPIEWLKRYDAPYPVEDLNKQKEVYEQWLTFSGFRRLYQYIQGKLVGTPWYFRVPEKTVVPYGYSIQEYPPYQVHPLQVTEGTFIPDGYEG